MEERETHPTRSLSSFLIYLHSGAFYTFQSLVHYLPNSAIKSLRLTIKALSDPLFPYLFRRIYISAHDVDLDIFKLVAKHQRARLHVEELVWDDTTFDSWIGGLESYADRLIQITSLPRHLLKKDREMVDKAYRFWAAEATAFAENRQEGVDRAILEKHVSEFPNLRRVTILSRSRLTYVDPRAYWDVWQTPRVRYWKSKPFYRHLIHPEPFKPAIGATVPRSEGIRPVCILREMAQDCPSFKIGALSVNSIGGGQTRATGSMNNSNRYQRKWHIDLHRLSTPSTTSLVPGSVQLHLLIETQTEDIFRTQSLWEELLDSVFTATADTLQEMSISNICFDWFWEYQQNHHNGMLMHGKALRKVTLHGGWCQDPTEILQFLRRSTTVRQVVISEVDVELVSWLEVLSQLKASDISFDSFEVRDCRCPSGFYPWQSDVSWAAPWSGPSKKIVRYLRNESNDFPLSQGPG